VSDFNTAFEAQFDAKDSEPIEVHTDTDHEDTGSTFEKLDNSDPSELLEQAKQEVQSNDESNDTLEDQVSVDKSMEDKSADEVEQEIINLIKAKSGEKEYEIDENAMFSIKIDGEDVDVSLSDLRSNYSGKTVWDRKFSELDTERKAYLDDKSNVEAYVNEFAALAGSGDKMKALEFLATISGQDALQFRRDLRSQVMEEVLVRQQMNEDQVKALELQEELDFVKRSQESAHQSKIASQTTMEVQNQVMGMQEAYGLSDQGLVELYDGVINKYGSDLTDGQIMQALQQEADYGIAMEGAGELLGNLDTELVNQENMGAVADLILSNPDFTEEDFTEIIQEAFGSTKSRKKTSTKVKKATQKATEPKKAMTLQNYVSFDDLD